MHQLYHYAPKSIDVLQVGLKSPVLVSRESLTHYFGRAKSRTKKGVLAYLENLFPGRSRAISVLTSPLTEQCCFYEDFKKNRHLYSIDFEALQRAGLVEAVYRIDGKKFQKINAPEILWNEELPWDTVGGGFFFTKIPHYMIVLTEGMIPPQFIKKVLI